jgi:hypothetical protein
VQQQRRVSHCDLKGCIWYSSSSPGSRSCQQNLKTCHATPARGIRQKDRVGLWFKQQVAAIAQLAQQARSCQRIFQNSSSETCTHAHTCTMQRHKMPRTPLHVTSVHMCATAADPAQRHASGSHKTRHQTSAHTHSAAAVGSVTRHFVVWVHMLQQPPRLQVVPADLPKLVIRHLHKCQQHHV